MGLLPETSRTAFPTTYNRFQSLTNAPENATNQKVGSSSPRAHHFFTHRWQGIALFFSAHEFWRPPYALASKRSESTCGKSSLIAGVEADSRLEMG